MIWLILSLLGAICAVIAIIALLLWLGLVSVEAFLECAGKALAGFSDKRSLIGLLYLILAGVFLYLIGNGLYLAWSFFTTVFK
jgi:hypothetical protein